MVMVIGGALKRGENCYYNKKGWKLLSETQFVDVTELPGDLVTRGPSICHFDLNRLILTGGSSTNVCAMFDMSTKKGTKMTNLKGMRTSHASGASCSNSFFLWYHVYGRSCGKVYQCRISEHRARAWSVVVSTTNAISISK